MELRILGEVAELYCRGIFVGDYCFLSIAIGTAAWFREAGGGTPSCAHDMPAARASATALVRRSLVWSLP